MWVIWVARNDDAFNGKLPNPLGSLIKIKSLCTEFLSSTEIISNSTDPIISTSHAKVQASPVQWRPPPIDFVKINSDCAFDITTGKGHSGIICRNSEGRLLTASSTRFFASSPFVAEALSLRDAISFAANLQFDKVIFESDNKTLIEVCNKRVVKFEIHGILQDIDSLRSKFVFSELTWTKREGNECAHTIASLAHENHLLGLWTIRPPPRLRCALVADAQALWKRI